MDILVNIITNYYLKRNLITRDKKEIYYYGFKLILADIINFSIIIVFGIILKRHLESIAFLISFSVLRQFSGGFHAKTFWVCRVSMLITFTLVVLLTEWAMYINLSENIVSIINALNLIFIGMFSPIENPNKPLNNNQRLINKIKSIITTIFLVVVSGIFRTINIKIGVTISVTLTAVAILMIIGLIYNREEK